jgi:serine/threonine protein kinase
LSLRISNSAGVLPSGANENGYPAVEEGRRKMVNVHIHDRDRLKKAAREALGMLCDTLPSSIQPDSIIHGYQFKRILGRGQFSVVWEAFHIASNEIVAIKCVRIFTEETRVKNLAEISLLREIDHPFIVRYFDSFEDSGILFIVLEFMACGTLLNYTNRRQRLSESTARALFSQILAGLTSLHAERHVIHRDIKTENILLDKFINVRLIDFGLAEPFSPPNATFTRVCGSPAYVAPEIAKGKPYNTKADIWSLGVVLYAITHGYLPFENAADVFNASPQFNQNLSSDLQQLISKMLTRNPEERISLDELTNHPWVVLLPVKTGETHEKVIARMVELGLNPNGIEQTLIEEPDSELAAIYRILSRRYLVEGMKDLYQREDSSRWKSFITPKTPPKPKVALAQSMKPSVKKPIVPSPKKK